MTLQLVCMNAAPVVKKHRPRPFRRYETTLRAEAAEERDALFEEVIRTIPPGKVATYGQVAAAAGFPRNHRTVARFLSSMFHCDIPWQRVVGAGGEIKVSGRVAATQRSLLKAEGVTFTGKRINIDLHGHVFDL